MSEAKSFQSTLRRFQTLLAGWSIARIFIVAAIACGTSTALVQFYVLNRFTRQFQSVYEQELTARIAGRLDTLAAQARPLAAQKKSAALRSIAQRTLGTDARTQWVGIYDASGGLSAEDSAKQAPLATLKDLEAALKWKRAPARRVSARGVDMRFLSVKGVRYLDASIPGDGRMPGVRLVLSLEGLDRTLSHILTLSLIFVIVSSALSTAVLWYVMKETLVSPINRITDYVRRAAQNLDKAFVTPLRSRNYDVRQVRDLTKAISDGVGEIALRNRTKELLNETREALSKTEERSYLSDAHALLAASGVADQCVLFIVRENKEQRRFLIEESSERPPPGQTGLHTINKNAAVARAPMSPNDMRADQALHFLKAGAPAEWSGNQLYIRATLTSEADLIIVVVARPSSNILFGAEKFETLIQAWVAELTRMYHLMRYQDLTSHLQLSREMQRKWVATDLGDQGGAQSNHALETLVGFETLPSRYINGDFLCVFKFVERDVSLVVLGDVNGHELRAGLAATGLVAALSDRFESIRAKPEDSILEEFMRCVNRYLWLGYNGNLGARVLGVAFNHANGQGLMSSFGMPFPYVISPQERKPMVIVPQSAQGLLGLSERLDYQATLFTALPGQVVFACTAGLLDAEDGQGRKFEKSIQRGVLSDFTDTTVDGGAQAIVHRIFDTVRLHAGNNSLHDDLTGAVFLTKPLP